MYSDSKALLRNKLNKTGEVILCNNKAKNVGITSAMTSVFNPVSVQKNKPERSSYFVTMSMYYYQQLLKIKPFFAIVLVALLFILTSCNKSVLPKPKAYLRLDYPKQQYQILKSNYPYSFEISNQAIIHLKKNYWIDINYPKLKATIDITYKPVNNNIKELISDAEKLTYRHAIKADGISSKNYFNQKNNVYGTLYEVTGNAASQIQFHLTDSTTHFITGSLYFYAEPNYDSILPAVKYIEKDIKHLMETTKWKRIE